VERVTLPRMPWKPSFDRQQNTRVSFVCLVETRIKDLIYHTRGGISSEAGGGGGRGKGQMLQTFFFFYLPRFFN